MNDLKTQEDVISLHFSDIALPLDQRIQIRRNEAENKRTTTGGNLTLEVWWPRKIGLIGANGAGKITLLKEIWKILRERKDIRVGHMPQHYGDLLVDESSPWIFLAPPGDKSQEEKL